LQSIDVALEAGDEAGVAGDLAVPAPLDGVVVEGLGVGELALQLGEELAAGLVVVAVLADVGVRAGFGCEVARAVAVGDSRVAGGNRTPRLPQNRA